MQTNLNSITSAESAPQIHATLAETAQELSADFAKRADAHDADESFVAENYEKMKSAGLVEAGVPAELGGGGADLRALCDMLRVLAHGCGSTALAFAMHTHQVAIPAWRWRNQPQVRAAVEPLLRRIASEKLILMSSGGSDWIGGSGRAEKVEGGYRITAVKGFSSGAPVGDLLMTGAIADVDGTATVLHFPVPMKADAVSYGDTWHTMGMRGTGSQDVQIDGLFVPDDKIALKRKAGQWHPLFQIIGTMAFPLIYAVYTGIAESARDIAIGIASRRSGPARNIRLAGQLDTALRATQIAHRAMIETAETASPSDASINEIMIGRQLVERSALETVGLAMDLAGGPGFYREAGLERRFRDIQGARYHPMRREAQADYAGAMALGESVATIF